MEIFEIGEFDGVKNNGWVLGHFVNGGARHTSDLEVKWARHSPGPTGPGWSTCQTATTLSVLISGRFQIEFRSAPVEIVKLDSPGQYVVFGPKIPHRAIALEESVFLTIRWPSKRDDCKRSD